MRALALVAVALALLTPGCLNAPLQPAATSQAPAPKADAPLTHVIDPAGGEGEPSLGVMPDGTLFTNGAGSSGGLYVSKDNGTTWKALGSPTAPWPNEDPDLAVSADGVLWYDNLWVGCTTVAASPDQGKTWTTSPAGCVPPAGDRQYVIPVAKGEAYVYSHQLPTFYQMFAHTTDYGQTWTPVGPAEGVMPPVVTGISGWGGGGFLNPKTGSVWATFTFSDGPLGSGATWSPSAGILDKGATTSRMVRAPNAGGQGVGLSLVVGAADPAGNVYLAWAEAKGSDPKTQQMDVYLASSGDDGKTWSKPKLVSEATNLSRVFPAITAGPAGEVAVAYYEADQPGYPAQLDKAASWNVTLAYTHDAMSAAPVFEHARLTAASVRHGAVCPDGSSCTANRQFLDYFALKRLPDGRVGSVFTSTDAVAGKTVNAFAATVDPVLG
ncbi:MAG: repeat-like domain [Thermoplasmata archaeon]|jgi:hypothetical protein|nr:repeat-like domain [Thermoplasmata archaeon]